MIKSAFDEALELQVVNVVDAQKARYLEQDFDLALEMQANYGILFQINKEVGKLYAFF
jgi:hypothetical protein